MRAFSSSLFLILHVFISCEIWEFDTNLKCVTEFKVCNINTRVVSGFKILKCSKHFWVCGKRSKRAGLMACHHTCYCTIRKCLVQDYNYIALFYVNPHVCQKPKQIDWEYFIAEKEIKFSICPGIL